MQDSIGLRGPVWALYFLSEEGIRKRRLWKWYWISWGLGVVLPLALPWLLPGHYIRPAHPWAAIAFALLEGVAGSLTLLFCARYVIPGRKPRQALWLTILCVLAVDLLLFAAGRPAHEMTVDDEKMQTYLAGTGEGSVHVDDPLLYIQTEYRAEPEQLQSWQAGDRMFVFTAWGTTFEFLRQADGSWQEVAGVTSPTAAGVLYTADPYGPEPYPSRLMLADGTVVEPVYEARFDTGYVPLFAFDTSQGDTYRGLLFGVDEAGTLHYELRTRYAIAPERGTTAYYEPGYFTQFGASEILAAADGPAFLAAWRAFRGTLWQTAPDLTVERSSLGVNSSYVLWAEHIAPPSLVVAGAESFLPADWGLAEYDEILFFYDDDSPARLYEPGCYYTWEQSCWADVEALLAADAVTPELLQSAAQTVLGIGEAGHTILGFTEYTVPYAFTRSWNNVDVPDTLLSLARAVRQELAG